MVEWATPRDLAADAAELIRDLNHQTLGSGAYRTPADVDATIAELEAMSSRLQQAIDQARKWLAAERKAGRVGDDREHHDGRLTVERANARLEVAAARAAALAQHLSSAREHTSHLTGAPRVADRGPGDGDGGTQ